MENETPPPGIFLTFCCFLTGVDANLLLRCPPRDRSSVVTITLLMLAVWVWQTLAFALTAHMLLDQMQRVHPELILIAALLAGVVMLVDSFTIMRSSWFLAGVAQLQRGGLEIPGALAARIKNGLQLLFRLPLAGVFAELAAMALLLFGFAGELDQKLLAMALKENAAIAARVAADYDAGSARQVVDLTQLRTAATAAQTDVGHYRLDALQTATEDPELRPAIEQLQRAEQAREEADQRLAQIPRHEKVRRRQASQRLGGRKADVRAAQARVDKLRNAMGTTASQRKDAVQGRLDETVATEQRLQTQIEAIEKEHAARLAAREDRIQAAILRDPGYRPADHGLLARARAMGQLLEDPWTFTVATLLHLAFFGIELGAVLCKVLTSVPSTYAVMLAGEEYAQEVEMANSIFQRIGGQPPLDQESMGDPSPLPVAPAPGEMAIALPEAATNDDDGSDAGGSTVTRLEEGARLATAQAVARAKARDKGAQGKEPHTSLPQTTLADDILDGSARRGPGRPPGAKNRPKPDNDDGLPPDIDVA